MLEGPSSGSSEPGCPEHIFLASPSPLFLLLFRFFGTSIGVSSASGVVGAVFALDFLLHEALVAWRDGCSVMFGGMGAVTDAGTYEDQDARV